MPKVRDALHRLGKFDETWNSTHSARTDRRLTCRYGTPFVFLLVLWMLAIQQWIAAAVFATLLPICVWAGAQIPGSKVQRLLQRPRRG